MYADILFLIDFSMDLLTFYIVSRFLKQSPGLLRICSASAMGGVYSVISLGLDMRGWMSLFFNIFVCFVMCMTVFLHRDPKHLRRMPIYTLTYFITSAMLGGVMTAIFTLLNKNMGDIEGGRDELSLWVFGFVALLGGLVTLFGGNILGRTSRAKNGKLVVKLGVRKATFDAISDSGNLLRDPICGKDVVVVDGKKAKNSMPFLERLDKGELPADLKRRVRMIPIRTASGEGLLSAFVPDEVVLSYDGEERRIDVLIAVSKTELAGGGCEAIVPDGYFV